MRSQFSLKFGILCSAIANGIESKNFPNVLPQGKGAFKLLRSHIGFGIISLLEK